MAKKKPKSSKGHELDSNGRPFCRAKTWSKSGRDTTPRKSRREAKNNLRQKEDTE